MVLNFTNIVEYNVNQKKSSVFGSKGHGLKKHASKLQVMEKQLCSFKFTNRTYVVHTFWNNLRQLLQVHTTCVSKVNDESLSQNFNCLSSISRTLKKIFVNLISDEKDKEIYFLNCFVRT